MTDKILAIISSPVAWVLTLAASVVSYFEPLKTVLVVMLVLVAADFVSGVWASRKSRIACSSRRLRKSFSKMAIYLLVMVLLFMIEDATESEWIGLNKFIAWAICMIEFISILENCYVITDLPVLKRIVRAIRGKSSEKYGTMGEDILSEKNESPPRHGDFNP